MKKVVSVILAILVLAISLCGCSSKEKEYIEVVNKYSKEKYSASLESGQDTYVKIVEDSDSDIEAYVYGGGLMFVIKKGGLDAYKNGESVLPFVSTKFSGMPGYTEPTAEELENEWEHFES